MVVRLFVGGLPQDISAADLRTRFSPFGKVENIELIPSKDSFAKPGLSQKPSASACRGFAYVELLPKDDGAVNKCLSVYNHSKWRGYVLRVELAKPSYLARLYVDWLAEAGHNTLQQQQPPVHVPDTPTVARPSEVSDGSFAAATAAAAAAAARRVKAAARGVRPGPVPLPAPTDLSQPLHLTNPFNRHRPIKVDLAHPSKAPRRAFPAVPPLPLARLQWQRADAEGEEEPSGSPAAGAQRRGGTLPAADAFPPNKRARIAVSGSNVDMRGRSALYHLNRVWSLPTRPYVPSATADGTAAANAAAGATDGAARRTAGVALPPPAELAAPADAALEDSDAAAAVGLSGGGIGAGRPAVGGLAAAAAPAPTAPKREVRGEVLSMFKVLKSIDSQVRKQAAEEAAGRLAAAKAAEARAGGAKRQGQRLGLPPAAAAAIGGRSAGGQDGDGGEGVVDFMDTDADGAEQAAGGQAAAVKQLLAKFGDSSDEEEGGAGGVRRQARAPTSRAGKQSQRAGAPPAAVVEGAAAAAATAGAAAAAQRLVEREAGQVAPPNREGLGAVGGKGERGQGAATAALPSLRPPKQAGKQLPAGAQGGCDVQPARGAVGAAGAGLAPGHVEEEEDDLQLNLNLSLGSRAGVGAGRRAGPGHMDAIHSAAAGRAGSSGHGASNSNSRGMKGEAVGGSAGNDGNGGSEAKADDSELAIQPAGQRRDAAATTPDARRGAAGAKRSSTDAFGQPGSQRSGQNVQPKMPAAAASPPSGLPLETPSRDDRPEKKIRTDAVSAGKRMTAGGGGSAARSGDFLVVPTAPPSKAGSHSRGTVGVPRTDALARFGDDSDGEEVFRDVSDDSADEGAGAARRAGSGAMTGRGRSAVPGPGAGGPGVEAAAPSGAAAAGRGDSINDGGPSTPGVVSFLDEPVSEQGREQGREGSRGTKLSKQQPQHHRQSEAASGRTPRAAAGPSAVGGTKMAAAQGRPGGGTGRRASGEQAPQGAPEQQRQAAGRSATSGRAGASDRPAAVGRGTVSAPASLEKPPLQPAGGLLAASFVRPSADAEALAVSWQAHAAGLLAGARHNARTAQRAMQGRSGRKSGAGR